MRIGILADAYKPHVSGVTNFIALTKQYLEERDHEVFVFTFQYEDYQDDEKNIIRSSGMPVLDTGFTFNLTYSREARRLLYTMDLAHVQHPFLSGSLAMAYCRPRGIPIIFTNHTRYDLYAQAYLPGVPEMVGTGALQAYLPRFCRSCDLVMSPSAGMKKVLQRLGVDTPIEVVPNGVDLHEFRETITPINRAEWGISVEDVILIFVGRLGPEKNLAFLLRSFAGTALAYDHVHLLLVGDGPERSNLEDQAAHSGVGDHVHFMGLVPYDVLPRYLASADAFVTASVTEVHPLTVIEAMASGLPVLGIDSPGIGDTINDSLTGYLVPDQDLAGFTAKMVRLAVDHAARKAMGVQARNEAQNYSIENTSRVMEQYYEQVVNQAIGRRSTVRARMTRWLDGWR
jgi:1,2-diacylglycerol 3-alpha-glucosyltransferase